MERWSKEWVETGITEAMRHADTCSADEQYTTFLAFLEGWLGEAGLSQDAKDAFELLRRRARDDLSG